VGDNPNLPRDPDKFDGTVDAQREFRERGVPSGFASEIYLDVYERRASFEPQARNLEERLYDAYAGEVARVNPKDNGIITAVVGDIDISTDGFKDNSRLYLPPTVFDRFAVPREINDGLLAPPFCPEPAGVGPDRHSGTGHSGNQCIRRGRLGRSPERFPTELNSGFPVPPCHCERSEAISGWRLLIRPGIASSRDALLAMTSFYLIRINELNLIGNRSDRIGQPFGRLVDSRIPR
jgi:hypothetical protein